MRLYVAESRLSGLDLCCVHEQAAYFLWMQMAVPREDELYGSVFLTVALSVNVYNPDHV